VPNFHLHSKDRVKKKIKPKLVFPESPQENYFSFAKKYAAVLAKHVLVMSEIADEVNKEIKQVEKNLIVICLVILGVPTYGRQSS